MQEYNSLEVVSFGSSPGLRPLLSAFCSVKKLTCTSCALVTSEHKETHFYNKNNLL
jgi:hypothetical protein